jgi:hypothetical protein
MDLRCISQNYCRVEIKRGRRWRFCGASTVKAEFLNFNMAPVSRRRAYPDRCASTGLASFCRLWRVHVVFIITSWQRRLSRRSMLIVEQLSVCPFSRLTYSSLSNSLSYRILSCIVYCVSCIVYRVSRAFPIPDRLLASSSASRTMESSAQERRLSIYISTAKRNLARFRKRKTLLYRHLFKNMDGGIWGRTEVHIHSA